MRSLFPVLVMVAVVDIVRAGLGAILAAAVVPLDARDVPIPGPLLPPLVPPVTNALVPVQARPDPVPLVSPNPLQEMVQVPLTTVDVAPPTHEAPPLGIGGLVLDQLINDEVMACFYCINYFLFFLRSLIDICLFRYFL